LKKIRLLTNFETTEEKLLQIVLAGQNDLAAILNREDLRQLKQRIEVRIDLKPLAPVQVGAYMRHRWARAGGSTPLPFSDEAIALIAKASRGIPRLVNSISDNALLLAYAGEEARIGIGHIQQVLRDFDLCVPEQARSNGKGLTPTDFNGPSARAERLEKRSSIAPRSFLAIEDDGPLKPSLAIRWAHRMNFGSVQPKGDKS
jgi:hypothetical protein